MKNDFRSEIRKVSSDILNVKDSELFSDVKYHDWIKKYKFILIPKKDKYSENSVHYDIHVNPSDYIKNMININVELEKSDYNNTETVKLFNALPLRTHIIPASITIDTHTVIHLIIQKDVSEHRKKYKKK
jgi:hypothetical protein